MFAVGVFDIQLLIKNGKILAMPLLGIKGTLHQPTISLSVCLDSLPTLQNNEPVPQVLTQVVNLSCLLNNNTFEKIFFFLSFEILSYLFKIRAAIELDFEVVKNDFFLEWASKASIPS